MKSYLALVRIDMKLALRNKSVLFFNYFFPLVFFFAFGQLYHASQGNVIIQVVAMVTAIGILGNGLFGAGIRAVQEREANVLRRYKVTPITPVPLLVASMTTGLVLYIPTVVITLVLASAVYGMRMPTSLLSFLIFVAVASAAFRSIGLIAAAVVNSSQESMLILQPLYLSMLFLSGATIPITIFPNWLQIVTQFIPATYLMTGIAGILQRGESLFQNWQSVLALILTGFVGLFISPSCSAGKRRKLKASAKLWVLVVLLPFIFLGMFQAWSKQDLRKARILSRDLERGQSLLIKNTRIFVGNGKVIGNGAVLVKNGKIDTVFEGASPDEKSLHAEAVDGAGKTVLPGLIDVHVHLGATGGFYDADQQNTDYRKAGQHELEAYLYSGITAVRSAGDQLDSMIDYRTTFNSGEKLGTELFFCGPIFTAPNGHGTEYAASMPETYRATFNAQFLRIPKSPGEARRMVDDLAAKHVDAIKGILDAGEEAHRFERMDLKHSARCGGGSARARSSCVHSHRA